MNGGALVTSGSLTFTTKMSLYKTRGQLKYKADLYCMTGLQAFRLEPVKSSLQIRYNELVMAIMVRGMCINNLNDLSKHCYDDNGKELIRWVYVDRRFI